MDSDQRQPISWALLEELLERANRHEAWNQAARWALSTLEEHLGQHWLERVSEAEGSPPLGLEWIGGHLFALVNALELALRLDQLGGTPGFAKVRKELRGDPRAARYLHSGLQLQLASQAFRLGLEVEFEPRATERASPSDLRLAWGGRSALIETHVQTEAKRTRFYREATSAVMDHVRDLGFEQRVWIGGAIADLLGPEAILEVEQWVAAEADAVRDDVNCVRRLNGDWGALEITSWEGERRPLTGPVIGEDLWPRFIRALHAKVEQMSASGASWLWLLPYTWLWLATPWGRADPDDRLANLAEALTTALDLGAIDGVVVCSSASGPSAVKDESIRRSGGLSVRRNVAPLRARETIVVPLSERGTDLVDGYEDLIGSETDWLQWALERAGLPALDEVMNSPIRGSADAG